MHEEPERRWRVLEIEDVAAAMKQLLHVLEHVDNTLASDYREIIQMRLEIDALAEALGERTQGLGRHPLDRDSVNRMRQYVAKVRTLTGLPKLATIREEQND